MVLRRTHVNILGNGDAMTGKAIDHSFYKYPLVALRDLITVNPRRPRIAISPDMAVGYVTPSNVLSGISAVTPMPCSMAAIRAKALQLQEGDVLVSRSLIKLQEGKVALVPVLAAPAFCSAELYVIRVNPNSLDAQYFFHFLRQPDIGNLIAAFLKDETGIHPPVAEFLHHLLLALPPLNDQRYIAGKLNSVRALTAQQCNELIEQERGRQKYYLGGQNMLIRVASARAEHDADPHGESLSTSPCSKAYVRASDKSVC